MLKEELLEEFKKEFTRGKTQEGASLWKECGFESPPDADEVAEWWLSKFDYHTTQLL